MPVERHPDRVRASPSLGPSSSRDVHEHASHHPGRDSEEVPAVLPVDRIPAEQAQAQLVDQRRRLEADARSLADQIPGRHAMQLVVDEGQHALERVGLAVAPGAEQLRDLAAVLAIWSSAHGRTRAESSRAVTLHMRKAQNGWRSCSRAGPRHIWWRLQV